jgi:hypothetical protein
MEPIQNRAGSLRYRPPHDAAQAIGARLRARPPSSWSCSLGPQEWPSYGAKRPTRALSRRNGSLAFRLYRRDPQRREVVDSNCLSRHEYRFRQSRRSLGVRASPVPADSRANHIRQVPTHAGQIARRPVAYGAEPSCARRRHSAEAAIRSIIVPLSCTALRFQTSRIDIEVRVWSFDLPRSRSGHSFLALPPRQVQKINRRQHTRTTPKAVLNCRGRRSLRSLRRPQ